MALHSRSTRAGEETQGVSIVKRESAARPSILGLITARSGSKGVHHKNVRVVAGKALIAWTIEAALDARQSMRVVVSTDDAEIASLARSSGAEVPFMRPRELATDEASHVDVVIHSIRWFEEHERWTPDYLVLLQPTSPLRASGDIDAAVNLAIERDALAVISVCPSPVHPYFIRSIDANSVLRPVCGMPEGYLRRQDLPSVYSVNGAIFLIRPDVLESRRTWYPDPTHGYVMPVERSLDVNTEWDLRLADMILRGDTKE